jgi:molybdopterin/thiamine biosynthesis adenylyltransferase
MSPAFHEIAAGGAVAPPPRGARLPAFLGSHGDPGPALDALKVVVVGAGSVGRPVAIDLARQQIDTLWVIDRGHYKAESLLTQPIRPDEVSLPKASSTARLCKAISPRTSVLALDGPVQALDEAALADADAWVLATDNLAAEIDVGQRCLHLGRPLFHAAVHGDTLTAQVRCFGNAGADGPCPACTFGRAEWAFLNRETVFSCEGGLNGETRSTTTSAPTMSVSFLCSTAANLALVQLFRHVLGLGRPVADTLVESCGYTHRSVVMPLTRNPDCPCEHVRWERATAPRAMTECSLRDLADAAGLPAAATSFTVGGLSFAEVGICETCGHHQPAKRFVAADRHAGDCAACGARMQAHPFYCHRPAPAVTLRTVLDRTLGDLHADGAAWAVARGEGRAVLLESSPLAPRAGSQLAERVGYSGSAS